MICIIIDKFKGLYRLRAFVDQNNNFPKERNGKFSENDVYIDCQNDIKIFEYSDTVLEAYIPSLGRGHNIIKKIEELGYSSLIYSIIETDSEILFKFTCENSDKIIPILKPKTSGAKISPFSNKNLPKSIQYTIPDKDLAKYKSTISDIDKRDILKIARFTTDYIKSIEAKDDMKNSGLVGKEYIHSIGKWDDYIKYLVARIKEV